MCHFGVLFQVESMFFMSLKCINHNNVIFSPAQTNCGVCGPYSGRQQLKEYEPQLIIR